MKLNKLIIPVACILLAGNASMAQVIMPWENRTETDGDPFAKGETTATKGKLHLEEIIGGRLIQTKGIGAMTWMKDGERYSRMEPNAETGGMDIVAYRAKDNRREVIIPSSMFINKETGKPIAIRSISWSTDNGKVLIYNNTKRVWRYDTRGDYWVLTLKDGTLRQLGKGLPESSMMFAKFSPDGTRVAFVSNNNIYVEDVASGQITQLTHDGSQTIVNGTFDWVYEEEFSINRALEFSYSMHMYAALGYVVYTLNPSGTTGFGQEFAARHVNAWGDKTADEIIQGTEQFCKEHSFVNPKKIGCAGASYGGFMTQYLQTKTDLFAAAVSHAGISALSSYWGEGYWGYGYCSVANTGTYPWNNPEFYTKHSPLFNADKIKTPLLLLHGNADTNVPVGESIQMFLALKLLGKTVEFVQVDGEDHGVADYKKRLEWQNTIFAWFAKYLKDEPQWWDALYPERHL